MNLIFKYIILLGILTLTSKISLAQDIKLQKVEPAFWWVGMKSTNLQLLVYGNNISLTNPSIDHPGIEIKSLSKLKSPNYLFIDLSIAQNTKPGTFIIEFKTSKRNNIKYTYELKAKRERTGAGQSVDASDVIYLITPDRFANGNINNDSTDDTLEDVNRDSLNGRHGGDLAGVMNHLDYLEALGITTLWLNPFLENNQSKYSYHGYGISDFYRTDSRFGTNEDFRNLVAESHKNGMKVIMDQVFNHCGSGHWWMDDLPSDDWINQWEEFTRSSFTNIAASDPHVSISDYNIFTKGWFDSNLPDLNLENKFLATYLIQNSIWWVEYAHLDGIRMDTYPYPNKDVMAQWVQALKNEYPTLYLVAETWESKASSLSYWNHKGANKDGYTSHITSVSDYPLYYAMLESFQVGGDIYKIYETLAEDFVYANAFNNKIFNGNHDVDRLFTLLNENVDKFKLSTAFLLTTRGIPQIYYGDEILIKGDKPDGNIRKDFPGGWSSDNRNAFTKDGRTVVENDVFNYMQIILKWRRSAREIHEGKLKHYQPYNNVYVYFRYTEQESTMIVINNSDLNVNDFSLERFEESLKEYSKGTDVITGVQFTSLDKLNLKANSVLIIKLEK